MTDWNWQGRDLVLSVRVQPRAAKDELKVEADGRLRLRVTAPPVSGKANEHLCSVLGRAFGVAKSRVTVAAGKTSRNKRIVVQGADPDKAAALGLERKRE